MQVWKSCLTGSVLRGKRRQRSHATIVFWKNEISQLDIEITEVAGFAKEGKNPLSLHIRAKRCRSLVMTQFLDGGHGRTCEELRCTICGKIYAARSLRRRPFRHRDVLVSVVTLAQRSRIAFVSVPSNLLGEVPSMVLTNRPGLDGSFREDYMISESRTRSQS